MGYRRVLAFGVCVLCLLWSSASRAESRACAAAYEKAQELRSESRLRAAREQLELCLQPQCSEFVRNDCGRWLAEVESSLPSVVLSARVSGQEVDEVLVFFDQETLAQRLDGRSVPVDPGRHTFRFVRGHEPALTLELVIREGEKHRLVQVDFPQQPKAEPTPKAPIQAAPAPQPRAHGWLPYALGGVGVLGLAGFTYFGLSGRSEMAERERTCAPECSDSDVQSVRTRYNLADLSLGVGLISLAAAGYLYFTAPRGTVAPAAESGRIDVDFGVTPLGGHARIGARF